jgi:hypothetical protein
MAYSQLANAASSAKGAQPAPGPQEGLLGDVLGQPAVAEQPMGKGAHAGLVHPDQLHERLAIAVAGRPNQRRLVHPSSQR